MIGCSHKGCIMFEKSLVFSFPFSMQLAIILKHFLTPKVQPAALGTDNIYKLQVSGFTLLIPTYKGYMWVLVTTGNTGICILSGNLIGCFNVLKIVKILLKAYPRQFYKS